MKRIKRIRFIMKHAVRETSQGAKGGCLEREKGCLLFYSGAVMDALCAFRPTVEKLLQRE